jgi:hypothetical protein
VNFDNFFVMLDELTEKGDFARAIWLIRKRGSGSGYGYGSGNGSGYGSGYGSGNGNGYGRGSGRGGGHGNGDGRGDGNGGGDGNGRGLNSTFTVRRISYGEGVERVFPVNSPRVEKVEVERRGAVRRAKLNYLRGRLGKRATLVRERTARTAGVK